MIKLKTVDFRAKVSSKETTQIFTDIMENSLLDVIKHIFKHRSNWKQIIRGHKVYREKCKKDGHYLVEYIPVGLASGEPNKGYLKFYICCACCYQISRGKPNWI